MAERQLHEFSEFKKRVARRSSRTPTTENAYRSYNYSSREPIKSCYSLKEIQDIIRGGAVSDMRSLSRYFYRVSGIYQGVVNLMANLPLYQTMVTPIFDSAKKTNKEKMLATFTKSCRFVENLNIPVTFANISLELLISGIYFGILREDGEKVVIQDLPPQYCRTRFKDMNGLNIIEFDVRYFDSIQDSSMRAESLSSFPIKIARAYKNKSHAINSEWVALTPEEGAVCFFYGDKTPLFGASIPQVFKMEQAVEREETRDENELYKLLIQKMPIDRDGELVFPLEEVAEIHESIADMLAERDTIDVLTTFGDTSLESLQDSTAASQSADRIKKYKTNTYDNLGVSSLYFNPDTSSAMPYMIKKDEAFMGNLTNQYSTWIKAQINRKFARTNLYFDFTILPTTRYNREEIQSKYFQGAQYGYSKMYAGVALGIPQSNIISLMSFENDFLQMTEKMVPLQSSYTSSSKISEENSSKSSASNDLNKEGGRPELAATEKSEKTVTNTDAQ